MNEQAGMLFNKYFKHNEENMNGLKKATYAYHLKNYEKGAHSFFSQSKKVHDCGMFFFCNDVVDDEKCAWCGRFREQIRWDNLPAECQARPVDFPYNIEDVLRDEEAMYRDLIKKGEKEIPRTIDKKFKGTVSAEALFYLHTTLGYDVECVSGTIGLDIDRKVIQQYDLLMDEHRKVSNTFKDNMKRKVT